MQKFENFAHLIVSPIIPSGLSVFYANTILTEVFEISSTFLHNYMDSTFRLPPILKISPGGMIDDIKIFR